MTSQEITQRTPMQDLVSRVAGEQFKQQVALALPENVRPERFARIAITALQQNSDLANCTHDSVFRSLLKCAADGLLPDGREAAIVKRGDQAVYQSMISGLRKIAAEYGWTLRTKAVYANDEFDHTEEPPTLTHRPVRPGMDRGELIAAYAIATHRDGRREQRVMYADEIAKRRALATTQNVWNKWPAEMAEKTAGRDLFAELPFADADRERIKSVLEASQTDPAEASRLMYGTPRTETPAALPAGTDTTTDETTTSPPPPAEQSTVDADVQQAAAAASNPPAATAPGPDDEEPALDEPSPFQAPTSARVEDDPVVAAGRAAAQFEIPNGQHKGLPLAELLQKGDKGTSWLRWALKKGDQLTPDEYRTAVWSFARVYVPELYTEVLAEHEAAS